MEKNDYQKVQKYLDKLGLLHFEDCNWKPSEKTSLQEVLEKFFLLNKNHRTLDEKGCVQCGMNRNRSLGDIYRILKNYRPSLQLNELHEGLMSLLKTGEYVTFICGDIGRRIWQISHGDSIVFYGVPTDEFDFNYTPPSAWANRDRGQGKIRKVITND